MEIRVNCNKIITLNNFNNLKLIRMNVLSYELKKALLTGDVKVSGEYFKDNQTEMGFEEIVPFTVVFGNENIKIENVYIDNDKYQTLANQGVDVSFELVVIYSNIDDKIITEENDNEEIIEVPVEIDEKFQFDNEKAEEYDNIPVNVLLKKANEITKEYDNLLTNVLNTRNEDSNVSLKTNNVNSKVSFNNQNTSYSKITIYYVNKESEIESISKERRISINDIYNSNSDFEKTRRIIINE